MDWFFTDECGCYGNHHEMFHIAQNELTFDEVQNALYELLGPDGFAADGSIEPTGVYFSTAKEDIYSLAQQLSTYFPNATIFGQDCWDYEGTIVCFKNGVLSTDYNAEMITCIKDTNNPDYAEVEVITTAPNRYSFSAGGGMVCYEEIENLENFINNGTGSYKPFNPQWMESEITNKDRD